MAKEKKQRTFGASLAGAYDNVIAFFDPKAGYQRKAMRKAMGLMDGLSSYKGAESNRLNNDWVVRGDSADQSLLPELPMLRKRSRWLNRNDAHAAGITKTVVTNTIGTGIKPQSRIDHEALGLSDEVAKKFQRDAEREWERWCPFADAGERLHFYEMQSLIDRQILENGEVFIIPIRIKDKNRPCPLAFEIIEADRVCTPPGMQGNKNIRDGVLTGEHGQPVKYFVTKGHPGDGFYGDLSARQKFIEYPAKRFDGQKNVFHLYAMERPSQTRGIPFFAPVLNYFKDFADYLEAEVVTARIAACLSVFIKKNDAGAAVAAATAGTDGNGKRQQEVEPGTFTYLEPGEDVSTLNPMRPGNTFEPFVFVLLRSICASLNLPYEIVTKDFSRTNFSSMRASLLQAYRYFRVRQEWLNRNFNKPVWDMVQEEAFLAGRIQAKDFMENKFEYCRVRWIAQGWEWVDPLKEAKASETALRIGITTIADECANQGKDIDDLLDQRARELARIKELNEKHGIQILGEADVKPAPIEQEDPEDNPDGKKPKENGGKNEQD